MFMKVFNVLERFAESFRNLRRFLKIWVSVGSGVGE